MAKIERKMRKKKNLRRIIKRVFILFIFFCLGGAVYSLGVAVYENAQRTILINDFKDRATFEYEDVVMYGSTEQVRRYYKVQRTKDYELNDTRSVFESEDRKNLGKDGDVFMTWESPFPNIPIIHQFISFYYGGHAALKSEELGYLQATGFPASDESLIEIILTPGDTPEPYQSVTANINPSEYWTNPKFRNESSNKYPFYGPYYRNQFVVVRVKDVDQEMIDNVISYAEERIDVAMYNFLFFLDMQYKYYCTDFVSRAYQSVLVPEDEQGLYSKALNDDWFITSVNDILLSNDTYMTIYAEVRDDIFHIYYLEDI